MTTAEWFQGDFFRTPVIAVLRGLDPATTVKYAENAWAAGVEHVEVPIQTPDALASLQAAVKAAAQQGRKVGAGTVTTLEQLDTAATAGVSFTVSPGLDPEIVAESAQRGIPHLPGVATASEILQAQRLGLTWLKAFPASELGPTWIKAMLGPFPHINFVATGGMTINNTKDMLDAGARVAGLSSAFASAHSSQEVASLIEAHAAPRDRAWGAQKSI
ncbi:bifunctional 4-hydroxy-2-oxoglutarate aldolase/2-dehydro-3-deoxy-phosphogluconate aldolase [Pseudarthrobacter sp. R1]|uniref:bifunctional 4-hydroxy-2-oxoglutarate aldolase/2-dehydro-3-deoxy-phosphogluconate aldolase n=1 Tax=Pseudarthrobacter sp. R1 TaxID=2944934 RepID=UPI0021089D59|nr:bifunctional 4-hydroxy-2-oxoglutarate aldolase/2-dehydro-3-deoxy-phosphogluconate aldolase [Pseudarthrobacter sp. R1]MCQ6273347.1 bifunctional 4-hydroxy-2-oxoglutarate aldolase/2-dehydro-3-deoxy-phosphogluconate aldolase [Pseudarthrobacter sp. R1]